MIFNNECFKNRTDFQRPTISTDQNSQQFQSLQNFKNYINLTDKFPSEGLTVSESKVLANERVKYLNFIKQAFKYKIPQQFLQKNEMIQRHRQYKKRIKQQRMKKQEESQIKGKKRGRVMKQKQRGGKKKVKGQQKVGDKNQKKMDKKEEDAQILQQQANQEESNDFENGLDDNFQSDQQEDSAQGLIDG